MLVKLFRYVFYKLKRRNFDTWGIKEYYLSNRYYLDKINNDLESLDLSRELYILNELIIKIRNDCATWEERMVVIRVREIVYIFNKKMRLQIDELNEIINRR